MKSRSYALLGLLGTLFALWLGANGCGLDTTGFGDSEDVCTANSHCDDANVCTDDTCGANGVCVHTPVSDGLFPDGVRGNCKAFGCKAGEQTEVQLKDDVDDGDECTTDVCTDTGATHTPSIGATCHLGGGLGKCDDKGECVVECGNLDESGAVVECPVSDDPCTLSYCDEALGKCVLDKLDGVPKPGTDPTDCSGVYCVAGATKESSSLADTPCMAKTPDGKDAKYCDGTGACVECNSDEQCADPNIPVGFCYTPTCTNHKCMNVVKDNVDLPAQQQQPSDCKIKRCAAGQVVTVPDDSDLPNDNNECTTDVCTAGDPSNPAKPQGTDCGTGAGGNPLVCNAVGVCVGCNSPLDCVGTDDACKARTCIAQECGVAYQPNGTFVSGIAAGDCQKQVCDGAGNMISAVDNADIPADDGNQCTDEVCTNGTPGHPNKAAGAACSDGNGCTQTDTCQAGACVGNNPVTCMALDQCHDPGVCNPASGMCSNPNKSNGTTCTDSNACTQMDSCQNGTCVGANPVVCTALDQCHSVGTCNTMTGVCSNPNKSNGTTCNDNNLCTQTDTCQTGVCTGSNPVTCTALDQCHTAGTCDMVTGMCSNPAKANGAACTDANACTQSDTCQNGTCVGANPVVCTALDQCHNVGTCNTGTGVCSNPNKANNTACNDSNACTQSDTCQNGTCTGANPVVCTAMDACHDVGTCNTGTGVCSNPAKANGTACNDGSLCTTSDVCTGGTCGGTPVLCTPNQCQTGGMCAAGTGMCSFTNKADGTTCNDNDLCTTSDQCTGGTCGGTAVVCTPNQCQTGGTCVAGTGLCSFTNKPDATSCNDNNDCTLSDECTAGTCGSTMFAASGTSCNSGAGTCNGAGVCIAN